jgi:hypothetical protein
VTQSTGLSLLARSGEAGWSAAAVNARGDPASRMASSVVQRPLSTEPKDRIGSKTDIGRCLKQMLPNEAVEKPPEGRPFLS